MHPLVARAAAIAAKARAAQADSRAQLRANNPDFAAWLDDFRGPPLHGKLTYLLDKSTGKAWGMTAEDRVRAAGGIGVSVPAAVHPKRKRRNNARPSEKQ